MGARQILVVAPGRPWAVQGHSFDCPAAARRACSVLGARGVMATVLKIPSTPGRALIDAVEGLSTESWFAQGEEKMLGDLVPPRRFVALSDATELASDGENIEGHHT